MTSLKFRVLLASSLVLLICMTLMGWAVIRSFEKAQYDSIKKELAADASVLLAAAQIRNDQLFMPKLLPYDKFNEVESPIFGQIYDQKGKLLWSSQSALDEKLYYSPHYLEKETNLSLVFVGNKDYFVYDISVLISSNNGQLPLVFMTSKPASEYYVIRNAFNNSMMIWQILTIIGTLVVLFVAIRWVLTPLNKLATSLNNIESGKQHFLENDYPREISRLTGALNTLLENELHQRERYKNAMADLAHSLKTPLAVIHSAQNSLSIKKASISSTDLQGFEQVIDEQVQRMNQIVSYQLQRAVIRQQTLIKKQVPAKRVAERISQTLAKVYRDKEVIFKLDIPENINFYGEEQDLMEVLGNLLENAFRLCLCQVSLACHAYAIESEDDRFFLEFIIEDDGPGIPKDKRKHVLERGVRADSLTPGQGIGLAVAMDIIDSYGGQLAIEESRLGGALFRLQLPGEVNS